MYKGVCDKGTWFKFVDVVVDKCGPVYTREFSSELMNVLWM